MNFVRIREYENRIQQFEISAYLDGQWKSLTTGTTIGTNKVIPIPKTTSTAIRLEIKKASGPPSLNFLGTGLR